MGIVLSELYEVFYQHQLNEKVEKWRANEKF